MFAGAKLKEVPRKQAEEFTADLGADPKFLRHVRRQQASEEVTRLYLLLDQVRAAGTASATKAHLEREGVVRRLRTEAALAYCATMPAALVAGVVAALPSLVARMLVAGAVLAVAIYYSLRARRQQLEARDLAERAERAERDLAEEIDAELRSLEARIKECERVIAECDAEGERHIKVIDPATFGTQALMPPQEKKKQE